MSLPKDWVREALCKIKKKGKNGSLKIKYANRFIPKKNTEDTKPPSQGRVSVNTV